MPPQQPIYTSPPNQYDFILQPHKRSPNDWLTHASMQTRILLLAGGFLGLLIIVIIFLNIIGGNGNQNTDQLVGLVQQQAEIARVAETPARLASLQTTQNFAITADLTMATDEKNLLALLQRLGQTPSNTVVAGRLNKSTDAALQAAQQDGTYDTAYMGIAQQQLATYLSAVQAAYNASNSQTIKADLSAAYTNAKLLVDLSQKT